LGYKQKSIATDTEMKLRYISAILIAATCAGAAFGARKSNARATKITPEELLQQAQTEFTGYNFEGALEKLEEYEAAQQKAKKPLSDEYHSLLNRVQTGTSMLDRVEDVEIIDSLTVDADKFFRYYRLSEPSGRITDSSSLPSDANPWPGSCLRDRKWRNCHLVLTRQKRAYPVGTIHNACGRQLGNSHATRKQPEHGRQRDISIPYE